MKARYRGLVVLGDVLLLFLITHLQEAIELSKLLFPICYFKQVTGKPCAVCGGTHAAQCLLKADFAGAFHCNAYVLLLLAFLLLVFISANLHALFYHVRTKKLLLTLLHYKTAVVLGIIAGVFSFFRIFVF